MRTNHKIIFGDSAKVLRTFPDNIFQLMVTSPPYWNVRDYRHEKQIGLNDSLQEYLDKLNEVWKEVVRTLMPDGKIALNIGNIYYTEPDENRRTTANLSYLLWKQLDDFEELRYMGTIYWRKTTSRSGAVLFGSYPYPSNFMISSAVEPIHVFRKLGKRKVTQEIKEKSKITLKEFREFRDAIWDINGVNDKHVAAYPIELPARFIKMFTFVWDLVLDPFVGSGSTTKAALELGRSSVGIDINPDFLKIIEEKVGMKQKRLNDEAEFEVLHFHEKAPKLISK
ncbi:site-specific DNA-methyltransferase [Candidatus Pacearchaeota archaeon]|nr:site-specific DNA-methyltransferase [Candidatus Pacearchaeota archaeon]